MSYPREARKRSKTIAFWVTPGQAAEIDEMVRTSGLTKQDYLLTRALEREVVIVPSSRVVKNLRKKSERIAKRLEVLASAGELSDALLDEIRWLTGLMAAFARYGEEEFDAVERIIDLSRD